MVASVFEPSDDEFLSTSESVTEGHPDKMADQISDAVLKDDPDGRVACETVVNTGLIRVSGEISTTTYATSPAFPGRRRVA